MVNSLLKNKFALFIICPLIFLASLTGCGNFSLYDELGIDYLASGGFMLIPQSPTLAVDNTLVFSVTGGTPPFVYTIVNPVGGSGTIDPGTGLYSAPSSPHTDVVQVRDNEGLVRSVSIRVVNEVDLQIFPSSLTISTNDIFFFTTIGGIPPYDYEITSGGGTIVEDTGEFHAPSSSSITNVRVTDEDGAGTSVNSTVTTREGLVIIPYTVSVPANNNITFTASGGVGPYTFEMVPDFDMAGGDLVELTGFYTAPASTGTEKVKVTDSGGYSSVATISVTPAQPLNIVPSSVIVLTGGSFNFSATGGKPPYIFTMVSGGGSFTGSNYFAPGTEGYARIQVKDSSPDLPVNGEVIIVAIGPLDIPGGPFYVEQGKKQTFAASGGIPQYVYSVLGNGFIISSTGVYTAPMTLGTDDIVRVTDAHNDTFEATVHIAPAAPTNLVAIGVTPDVIELSWEDNSTYEGGFSIEIKPPAGVFTEIATTAANAVFFPVDGLLNNTRYTFRVRAFAGTVFSAYSNEDSDETD